MIKELTGGDVCFGQPINTIGVFIAMACAIFIWEAFWMVIGSRK